MSRTRYFLLSCLVLSIALGANAVAALSGNWLGLLIAGPGEQSVVRRLQAAFTVEAVLISQAIQFVVPTLLIIWYNRSLFGALRDPRQLTDEARRRIVNMPIATALFGMLGWTIALVQSYALFWLYTPDISALTVAKISLNLVLLSILTFVLIYFALEEIGRRFLIPLVIREGRLSSIPGTVPVSLAKRLVILFLAVSVYPIFVVYQIWLRSAELTPDESALATVTVVVLVLVMLGMLLTVMIARTYSRPLESMRAAVEAIRAGAPRSDVPVTSVDEFGLLAENLNDMARELREKELIRDTFGRMVAPEVRDHLLRGNLNLGGELREATVLFADLHNFTNLSESLPPDQLVRLVNRYFDLAGRSITQHGGFVNKFIGDAILAVFGAPDDQPDHANNAVAAAAAIRSRLAVLRNLLAGEGSATLSMGIGIHSGHVLAGNIGSQERMEYTVMGDTVNTASRVEQLTRLYGVEVLVTGATVERLSPRAEFVFRQMDRVRVKGRRAAVTLFELWGWPVAPDAGSS